MSATGGQLLAHLVGDYPSVAPDPAFRRPDGKKMGWPCPLSGHTEPKIVGRTKRWTYCARCNRYWCTVHARIANYRRRSAAIAAYGGFCVCCGENQRAFLCIDHIDGNGAAHRRSITGGDNANGPMFFLWLEKNKYPPGFQVLCWNCNAAKEHLGQCPHQGGLLNV